MARTFGVNLVLPDPQAGIRVILAGDPVPAELEEFIPSNPAILRTEGKAPGEVDDPALTGDATGVEDPADPYPADGTIPAVLAWVERDPATRTRTALEAESRRPEPRRGIVEALEA